MQLQLEEALRAIVVDALSGPDSVVQIRSVAERMNVSSTSVEELLERPRWELGLTFKLLDVLGIEPELATP